MAQDEILFTMSEGTEQPDGTRGLPLRYYAITANGKHEISKEKYDETIELFAA